MKVWNGIESYPPDAEPVVASIGNYDGVHLGHRAILEDVVATARARDLRSLLLTFEPHPVAVVAPDRRPRLLMTRRQKLEELEAVGLDGTLLLRFDERLAALGGDAFFDRYLISRVPLAALRVGSNFRFGHRREGDLALLAGIGSRHGFDVEGVPPVRIGGEVVSSSAIRAALSEGDVPRAWRLLGRPYEIEGTVVRGEGRGRRLEFPTANLDVANETLLPRGVYVAEVRRLGRRYAAVANLGRRPTFDVDRLTVETHLLEFEGDLYGETIGLRLLARLRDERRFDHPDELADQIARDCAAASSYFRNLEPLPS